MEKVNVTKQKTISGSGVIWITPLEQSYYEHRDYIIIQAWGQRYGW